MAGERVTGWKKVQKLLGGSGEPEIKDKGETISEGAVAKITESLPPPLPPETESELLEAIDNHDIIFIDDVLSRMHSKRHLRADTQATLAGRSGGAPVKDIRVDPIQDASRVYEREIWKARNELDKTALGVSKTLRVVSYSLFNEAFEEFCKRAKNESQDIRPTIAQDARKAINVRDHFEEHLGPKKPYLQRLDSLLQE